MENRLKRLAADFENFKKRSDRERIEIISEVYRDSIYKLLPVLDEFELALQHAHDA